MMSNSTWDAVLALPVLSGRDHLRGPADAPVKLVEYGDYECGFCAAAHPIVTAILQQMGDELCYVYRHFPISTMHPRAERAAEAAEAAGAQREFWGMHDILFNNHPRLSDEHLVTYAQALRLDVPAFTNDVVHHVHAARVREDFMSGVHSGVNGTPTFYVNGVRHDGSWDLPSLSRALAAAAAQASARV
jgi:protein-disulfide isomerase